MSMNTIGVAIRCLVVAFVICLTGCQSPDVGYYQEPRPSLSTQQPALPTNYAAQLDHQSLATNSPAPVPPPVGSNGQTSAFLSSGSDAVTLRAGDTIRIDFPGAPNLNTRQQISRDGIISLSLVGDVVAAGKTPRALQEELKVLYAPQLVTKEVTVSIESAAFPFFVTGAVLRPGPYSSSRPISVLEAVMQAGGFDETRANKKAVRILREGNKPIIINLKQVIEEGDTHPFYLKPSDTVYVPERFRWF